MGNHPHLFGIEAEHDGDLLLGPHDGAAAGMDRVAAGRGIVGSQRRPGLHRHAGDAGNVGDEAHDMRRLGEARLRAGAIAHHRVDGDISDQRQCFVLDLHRFGGVLGPGERLGNHEGHALADKPHGIDRQDRRPDDQMRRAVGVVELDVGRTLRLRDVMDGL